MSEFFRFSLNGAVFIAVICILRFLFRQYLPRTAFVVLWLAALFRLLCPVRLPFAASIWRLFEGGSSGTAVQGQITFMKTLQEPAVNAQNAHGFFEAIWLFIAVVLLGGVLIGYLHGARESRKAEQIETMDMRVYRCKTITSPKVCGILRPRILLPENIRGGAAFIYSLT